MWLILSSYLHIQVILLQNYWTKQTQLGEGFSQAWFHFRSICFLLLTQFRAVGWGLGYTRWVSLSQGQHKDRKKEKHWKQFSQHAYFVDCGTEETRTGQTGRTCMCRTEGPSQSMDSSSGPRTVISIASLCTPDFTSLLSYCFFVVEMCC